MWLVMLGKCNEFDGRRTVDRISAGGHDKRK